MSDQGAHRATVASRLARVHPPCYASRGEGWRTDQALFAELKRRRVFRALIGYGIVAFAVLQIIEPLMHGLHWPESVLSYVVVALALGFPLVVTLAWIYDVRGGRIERHHVRGNPARRAASRDAGRGHRRAGSRPGGSSITSPSATTGRRPCRRPWPRRLPSPCCPS